MPDNVLMIAAEEARFAAAEATGDVRIKLRAAMDATADHWLLTDPDKRLQAAVAGASAALGAHPDALRLREEWAVLVALGGPGGTPPAMPEKAVGILGVWREALEAAGLA